MGCCATKPKVLKEQPVPIPPSHQPLQDPHKPEPDPNRRRSLSNLLEEEMRTETKTPTRPSRSKSLEDVTQELLKPMPDIEKEPVTRADDTVQYLESKSVRELVADIEKLNEPKSNADWIPVPVALRQIELGASGESNPTPKAATHTQRLKWTDVEIEHPVKPFEQKCNVDEPESATGIPEGMIMNLKIEDIAYEIEQLYKPDMMDFFPAKSEPEASTYTEEVKHVDVISNQKIEQPSNGTGQIYRPDPADVAPGNTEPMEAKSAQETNISIQPTQIEPALSRKVLEHIHNAEQVAIA